MHISANIQPKRINSSVSLTLFQPAPLSATSDKKSTGAVVSIPVLLFHKIWR